MHIVLFRVIVFLCVTFFCSSSFSAECLEMTQVFSIDGNEFVQFDTTVLDLETCNDYVIMTGVEYMEIQIVTTISENFEYLFSMLFGISACFIYIVGYQAWSTRD